MDDRRSGQRERRASRRIPLTAAVLQRGDDKLELAQALNIAAAGMTLRRLVEARPYMPMSVIELTFQLPGGADTLRVSAEVVFDHIADGYRATGVRFIDLDEAQRGEIAAYLAADDLS